MFEAINYYTYDTFAHLLNQRDITYLPDVNDGVIIEKTTYVVVSRIFNTDNKVIRIFLKELDEEVE